MTAPRNNEYLEVVPHPTVHGGTSFASGAGGNIVERFAAAVSAHGARTAFRSRSLRGIGTPAARPVRLKPKTKEKEPHTWGHVGEVQHCVQAVKLPARSDDRAVLNWCSTALTPMLPRDQPLWWVYILSGISEGPYWSCLPDASCPQRRGPKERSLLPFPTHYGFL